MELAAAECRAEEAGAVMAACRTWMACDGWEWEGDGWDQRGDGLDRWAEWHVF